MIRTLVLASLFSLGLCFDMAMPGGYSTVTDQTQLKQYTDLFTELQTNGALTGVDSSCTVDTIEQQVVAGLNIKYHLSCTNGQTCEVVVFWQSWTNTKMVSSNKCHSKRQVGGYYTQTDPVEIQKYADKLTALATNGQLTLEPYTVVKVETQVVAGINIKYTLQIGQRTCHIVLFEQSWTNTHQITSNDCTKVTRQLGGGLLGGWHSTSTSNPEIQACMSKSLDSINQMSNSLFRMVDSQVVSAKQQVVAGMNYAVTFQTMPSTCLNNQQMLGKTSADCPVDQNSVQQPTTWEAHCFHPLNGLPLELSNVNMVQ